MSSKVIQGSLACIMALWSLAAVADGAALASDQCASCHALERPDHEALGVAERFDRKAPLLYFAGNKYRQEWLVEYLQNPQTLHPTGYFPNIRIDKTSEGDLPVINEVPDHPQLDASEAAAVAEYLMTLRPYDELLADDSYEPSNVARRMATMDFRRFKGCDACHQDEVGTGGFSGPTLYSAWTRLQPEYLSSFIKDPTAWDPHTTMPVMEMNDAAVHRLVDYLKLIGEAE